MGTGTVPRKMMVFGVSVFLRALRYRPKTRQQLNPLSLSAVFDTQLSVFRFRGH